MSKVAVLEMKLRCLGRPRAQSFIHSIVARTFVGLSSEYVWIQCTCAPLWITTSTLLAIFAHVAFGSPSCGFDRSPVTHSRREFDSKEGVQVP